MSAKFTVPAAEVIEWRRHLHAHPELSNQEVKTAAFVERVLRTLGLQPTRPTPTSLVADIIGTAEPRPGQEPRTIAFRADMDALPVQEETGEHFASVNQGVMHACGHDAHTAMLLGTAKTLVSLRDTFAGTVRLIFQHAEELNPGGAKFMVENGVMDGVDEVFGIHVMNGPVGTVDIARGPATSSAGGFFLNIQGQGSHGSMPHKGIDPVLCASQVVVALNHVASREVDPDEFIVVNPGMIASGAAPNVVPDTARLGCSIRTYHPEIAKQIYARCEEVVKGICLAYRCGYEFEWVQPYDIVVNEPALADEIAESVRQVLGADKVKLARPMSGSEDFSEYLKKAPGTFLFLNAGDETDGLPFQNHHPKFNIVEKALAEGVKVEVQLLLDRLAGATPPPAPPEG